MNLHLKTINIPETILHRTAAHNSDDLRSRCSVRSSDHFQWSVYEHVKVSGFKLSCLRTFWRFWLQEQNERPVELWPLRWLIHLFHKCFSSLMSYYLRGNISLQEYYIWNNSELILILKCKIWTGKLRLLAENMFSKSTWSHVPGFMCGRKHFYSWTSLRRFWFKSGSSISMNVVNKCLF